MPPPCADYLEILEASTLATKEPVKACIWIAYLLLESSQTPLSEFQISQDEGCWK